jgi:hypothetical protein
LEVVVGCQECEGLLHTCPDDVGLEPAGELRAQFGIRVKGDVLESDVWVIIQKWPDIGGWK